MKKMNIFALALIVLAIVGLASCDDELNQTNPNNATEQTFWKDSIDFEKALISCYSTLKNPFNGGYYGDRCQMLRIARGDDVEFRSDLGDPYQSMNFTNSSDNGTAQTMFFQFYNVMYRTNSIFQKLEEKKDLRSKHFIDNARGEALFFRGLNLFNLGKEFKNAPLRLTASQSPSTFPLAKSNQAEIWAQAVADLKEAYPLLPIKAAKRKITRGAALAVLGKVYLYQKEYDKAIDVLEPLTKSPYNYKLISDFKQNFDEQHAFNEESIMEIPNNDVGGTGIWVDFESTATTQATDRAVEYAAPEAGGWYEATPTQHTIDMFTSEKDKDGNIDYRARVSAAWDYPECMYYLKPFREKFAENRWNTLWILKYQNWEKAERESSQYKSMINERIIRYDMVLLELAECYLFSPYRQDLQKAVNYINQIRRRAKLNDYSSAMTQSEIFKDLEKQRYIEFFVEGERFYDLIRWGLLEKRIKAVSDIRYRQLITGVASNTNKYYYFPIPSKEINTNTLCEQNEGW